MNTLAPSRSAYSSAIATISTGNEPTTMSTLTSPVHVKTGMRIGDMPGARRWRIVPSTQAPTAVSPSAARITPIVHTSWPTPGVLELFESGT